MHFPGHQGSMNMFLPDSRPALRIAQHFACREVCSNRRGAMIPNAAGFAPANLSLAAFRFQSYDGCGDRLVPDAEERAGSSGTKTSHCLATYRSPF